MPAIPWSRAADQTKTFDQDEDRFEIPHRILALFRALYESGLANGLSLFAFDKFIGDQIRLIGRGIPACI
jgi:hypothetical protein